MSKPSVSEADVRRAYRFLRVLTPYNAMSAPLRAIVTATARARLKKRSHTNPPAIDLKRRAAGDLDD
ncbi:hypothetical protein [Ralstonia sp. UBA689]|uniref:hypothetical protein n=1 Tax=Ralstonia sp. UBA689 TaxID=1947373 RepID=UPI0025D45B4F|nr:hypothetical protein [Ralstonia sp. UBA689]